MSIIASAKVPAAHRLIDAPTVDLMAVRRPRSAAFLTELGRRVDNLFAAGRGDQLAEHARALGSTEAEALAARDAYRRSLTAPADDRYAEGYADGLSRALTADRELVKLAARRNPVGVHLLAEAIRNGCPPWCTSDHSGDALEADGLTLGQVHERIVTELPAADPAWVDRPATAVVLVESTSEAGTAVTPARVILAVAEGADGAHPGEQDCQGWTGTPAQARALAAALLAGADLVDGGAR